jgi:anti-sigma B factor antagonist
MNIRQRTIGAAAALDVTGRLVLGEQSGDALLQEVISDLLLHGQRDIIVNLDGVSQVDTSGLTALVGAHLVVARRNGRVKLVNSNGRIRKVLHATRLDTVFEVFDSEGAALASFGHAPAPAVV